MGEGESGIVISGEEVTSGVLSSFGSPVAPMQLLEIIEIMITAINFRNLI